MFVWNGWLGFQSHVKLLSWTLFSPPKHIPSVHDTLGHFSPQFSKGCKSRKKLFLGFYISGFLALQKTLSNGSKIIQFQRNFDFSHLILNILYSWSKVQTLKHPMCKVGIHVWVMGMCPFDSWTISLKSLGKCCIFLTFILFWTCIQPNSSLSFHLGCCKQCTHKLIMKNNGHQ
jgi:hypothetical protein